VAAVSTAASDAQLKVLTGAQELPEPLIDLDHPADDHRLSLEASMLLIEDRYSEAIKLLGRL
jgi:hypothetical protein